MVGQCLYSDGQFHQENPERGGDYRSHHLVTQGLRCVGQFVCHPFLTWGVDVWVYFICITLVILFMHPCIAFVEGAGSQTKIQPPEQANPQNKIDGIKIGGIVGDPSHKRGLELGYDMGPRAGSEDKAQNKNPDPSLRHEYKKPEQFYRYEFGYRSTFIAGFRRGFLRGYKSTFGKMGLKRTETTREPISVTFPNALEAPIESVSTREILPKKLTLAEDAL
jgi:hypothetical protein